MKTVGNKEKITRKRQDQKETSRKNFQSEKYGQ